MNRPFAIRESEIQDACVQLLQLDRWRPLRTDPVADRSRGKGFGERGMADHLFIRYKFIPAPGFESGNHLKFVEAFSQAEVLWIEFKCLTGKSGKPTKAAPKQKAWHRDERLRGAMTLIAGEDFPATIDGFLEWYRGSGLMRRKI